MYALKDEHGNWASGRNGRFVYGTHQLAIVAARILGKRDQRRYRVVDA